MALDGRVEATVFEAKFMLSWTFSEEAATEKYMPQLQHKQLQHNMCVVAALSAVLSFGPGGWLTRSVNRYRQLFSDWGHGDPLLGPQA
jgi:hypothetical protein